MAEEKKGFFKRLVEGLSKTRNNIVAGIDSIFNGFSNIDEDFYEEIEEILIMGDIGVNATNAIIENLKKKVKENKKSGNFKNQESYDVRLIKYTYVNDDYNVTIERDYKHDKSDGKQTTTIDYKMKKVSDNTFKIVDYTEK